MSWAIVADGRIVDGQELERLPLDDPHRERALLEEQPVRFFGLAHALGQPPGLGDVPSQAILVLGSQLLESAEAAEARAEDHRPQRPGAEESDAETERSRGNAQRYHDGEPAEQGRSGQQGQPPERKEDGTRADQDQAQHQALQGLAEHAQVEEHDHDRKGAAADGEWMGPSLGEGSLAEGVTEAGGHDRGSRIHEDERPFRGGAERAVHDREHRLEDGDARRESRQGVPHDAVASGLSQVQIRSCASSGPPQPTESQQGAKEGDDIERLPEPRPIRPPSDSRREGCGWSRIERNLLKGKHLADEEYTAPHAHDDIGGQRHQSRFRRMSSPRRVELPLHLVEPVI